MIRLPLRSTLAYLAMAVGADLVAVSLPALAMRRSSPAFLATILALGVLRLATAVVLLASTWRLLDEVGARGAGSAAALIAATRRGLVVTLAGAAATLAVPGLTHLAAPLATPLAAVAVAGHYLSIAAVPVGDPGVAATELPAVRVATLVLVAVGAGLVAVLTTTVGLRRVAFAAAAAGGLGSAEESGAILGVAVALGLGALAAADITRGLAGLAQHVERIASGDGVVGAMATPLQAETARLLLALERVTVETYGLRTALRDELDRLRRLAGQLVTGGERSVTAARSRGNELEGALLAAQGDRTLQELEPLDSRMIEAAAHGETAIAELSQQTEQNTRDIELVARSGDGAQRAALDLADGTTRFASATEGLAREAADLGNSMRLLVDAMSRVNTSTGESSQLAEVVAAEAEKGYRAVHRTLDQIERIREMSDNAHRSIEALGARMLGIGNVVSVIQEIAEKTNLLALNASIIAAQAGEHGRGFAIVAAEIKALAQRTASSTKEIAQQIRSVQDESAAAMGAMSTGVDAVQQGFQVAVGAGDALSAIRESARAAQRKILTITRIVAEQAGAVERVSARVQQLAAGAATMSSGLHDQADAEQRLRRGTAEIALVAHRLRDQLSDRAATERRAAEAAGTILEATTDLRRGHRELRGQSERVRKRLLAVRQGEQALVEILASLSTTAVELATSLHDVTAILGAEAATAAPASLRTDVQAALAELPPRSESG